MDHRPLATVQELADFLNIKDTKTVRNWARSGYGPPVHKIGGSVRYLWSEIEAFVEASKVVTSWAGAEELTEPGQPRVTCPSDVEQPEGERCGCI